MRCMLAGGLQSVICAAGAAASPVHGRPHGGVHHLQRAHQLRQFLSPCWCVSHACCQLLSLVTSAQALLCAPLAPVSDACDRWRSAASFCRCCASAYVRFCYAGVGLAMWALGAVFTGVSFNYGWLLFARIFTGAGQAKPSISLN